MYSNIYAVCYKIYYCTCIFYFHQFIQNTQKHPETAANDADTSSTKCKGYGAIKLTAAALCLPVVMVDHARKPVPCLHQDYIRFTIALFKLALVNTMIIFSILIALNFAPF